MIQNRSMLKLADNTGAKIAQCIKVLGGHKKRYARIGDIITVAIKEAAPHSMVKKGDVMQAVIVRTRKEIKRDNGVCVRFDENACVLIDPKSKEPKGTRIFGPVTRELRDQGYIKIISLAPEVL